MLKKNEILFAEKELSNIGTPYRNLRAEQNEHTLLKMELSEKSRTTRKFTTKKEKI